MPDEKYLETETAKALNSIPLTRRAKKQIKKAFSKMDEQRAGLLLIELRDGVKSLKFVMDVIEGSRNL